MCMRAGLAVDRSSFGVNADTKAADLYAADQNAASRKSDYTCSLAEHCLSEKSMLKSSIVRSLLVAAALLATAVPAAFAEQRTDLLGDPVSAGNSGRVIRLETSTRYVNVEGGETILFYIGEKSFGWNFSGPLSVTSFNLRQVMPAGLLDHDVTVYIRANPNYRGPA